MTLIEQKKLANHIFRLLKVNEIILPIGRTNKGNLGIKFSQNSEDFDIYLDAVPLSTKDWDKDENNIEIKKVIEKYLFQDTSKYIAVAPVKQNELVKSIENIEKKRGRPKGSKNKK